MAAPKKVDYARIEPGWRAGILSPMQLAAEYTEATGIKVSHTAIIKHFKKLGVPRDLRQKIQAKADAMVAQAKVTGKVSAETTKADAEIIEANATEMASVKLAHCRDIGRGRALVMSLLGELEAQTADPELFERLGELMTSPGEEDGDAARKRMDRLQQAFQAALSLSGRADTLKKLSDSLRIMVDKEREAFGIGDTPPKPEDPPATEPTNAMAREIVYALQVGLRRAETPANDGGKPSKAA